MMSDLYDPMTLHKYVCYCYCCCYCCCCDLVESFAFPERCGAPSVCGSGAFLARLARPRQAAAMLVTAVTTGTGTQLMRMLVMLGDRRDAAAAVTARRCRVTHVLSQQSHTRLPSTPTRQTRHDHTVPTACSYIPPLHGPDRTRTDFFVARVSEKLRWVRAGLRQSPYGSVRVRSGPCSGI